IRPAAQAARLRGAARLDRRGGCLFRRPFLFRVFAITLTRLRAEHLRRRISVSYRVLCQPQSSSAARVIGSREFAFASVIFRALEELKAWDCIRTVHDFEADDTFCCIAFALGNRRRCRRIERSAMRAEESATF